MKQKGFAPILVVLIFSAIFAFAGAGYWYSASNKKVAQEDPKQDSGIQNSGRSNKTSAGNALYPDLSRSENLVGDSHNVFVGKVIKVAGKIVSYESEVGETRYQNFYKQFEIKVLLNIKGDLGGSVLVNVEDGSSIIMNNTVVREIPGSGTPLSTGAAYLLATRYRKQDSSYTLIEVPYGWKLLSDNDTLSDEELINLAAKDSRVNELRIAYPNEILGRSDVYHNTTRNSFVSLPQEKQDQLRAEAEQLKAQMQK
jgi:hypothetical protein